VNRYDPKPYMKAGYYTAETMLNAVEAWAEGAILIREIGLKQLQRLDGVLVPYNLKAHVMEKFTKEKFFNRCGLVGLEVKRSRSDFLAGIKKGQFEKYNEYLMGLYLVTFPDICKRSEVPDNVGLIHIMRKRHTDEPIAFCKKHPIYKHVEYTQEMMWRIMFRYFQQFSEKLRDSKAKQVCWENHAKEIVGDYVERTINASVTFAEKNLGEDIRGRRKKRRGKNAAIEKRD